MIFTKTHLEGAYIIDMQPIEDNRGWFSRAFCKREFEENGLCGDFVQHNMSYNKQIGTIRGMHFQRPPYEEIKVVQCIKGKILDVIIDIREDSDTYLKWLSVELCENNRQMLYVPKGFAHGYQTLCDDTVVFYLVSEFYKKDSEGGLRFDDETIGIKWPINHNIIISEKDAGFSLLKT